MRMVACGHTTAHLPQSMQMSGSQIGMVLAMARFSYAAVPVGNVPSTGMADTGSRSPSPAMSSAVTRWTKSGAASGTVSATARSLVTSAGTSTRRSAASEVSMAAKFCSTTVRPRLP
jgi:hypothetical protein